MKNKSTLMLLELVIMLLVFLLAAALCLRAFAWADTRSAEGSREDMALLQAQNAAEVLKAAGGNFAAAAERLGGQWDSEVWLLRFDENWEPVDSVGVFILEARPEKTENACLGAAQVQIRDEQGKSLAQLRLCWQEVAP